MAARTSSSGNESSPFASAKYSSSTPSDLVALDRHVTTTRESEWFDAGGAVERLGDRCAPVDDERIEFIIGDRQSTDVVVVALPELVRCVVDATEEKGLVADRELVETM